MPNNLKTFKSIVSTVAWLEWASKKIDCMNARRENTVYSTMIYIYISQMKSKSLKSSICNRRNGLRQKIFLDKTLKNQSIRCIRGWDFD